MIESCEHRWVLTSAKHNCFFMDEDIQGDLSSAIFEHNMKGTMHFIAKESVYFSGNEVIVQGFNIVSESRMFDG